MELDPVEARVARAAGRGREPPGDAADLVRAQVLDGLPVTVEEIAARPGIGEMALEVGLELSVAQDEDDDDEDGGEG